MDEREKEKGRRAKEQEVESLGSGCKSFVLTPKLNGNVENLKGTRRLFGTNR